MPSIEHIEEPQKFRLNGYDMPIKNKNSTLSNKTPVKVSYKNKYHIETMNSF